MTPTTKTEAVSDELTRPIVGIENRSAAEVFDIMCDRIKHQARRTANPAVGVTEIERLVGEIYHVLSMPRHPAHDDLVSLLTHRVSPVQEEKPVAWLNPDNGAIAKQRTRNNTIPLFTRPASPVSAEVTEAFQTRVSQAHVALFHDDPTDVPERVARFYEESTEVVQSLGMTEAEAHALVSYTFSRPVGTPEKEIGAAALTLASLCVEAGYDMMACAEADLAALVTPEKIAKVRAKRATRHGRGPLPGFDAALSTQGREAE